MTEDTITPPHIGDSHAHIRNKPIICVCLQDNKNIEKSNLNVETTLKAVMNVRGKRIE
jgi:hypothetical protein